MSERTLAKVLDEANKKMTPEGAIKPAIQSLAEEYKDTKPIPCFTPGLGYILGLGGWPEGQLVEFYGVEGAGKSTLALLAAKDCYDYYNGEKDILYIDLEHKFDRSWAEQLGAVPDNKAQFHIVQPTVTEDAIDLMRSAIRSQECAAIVFDSIGFAGPEWTLEDLKDAKTRVGGNAQLMKRMVNAVSGLADTLGCTIFFINQMQDDMSGYHQDVTPGGRALKHAFSIRMKLNAPKSKQQKFTIRTPDEPDFVVGYEFTIEVKKSTFGPRRQRDFIFYNVATDVHQDYVGFDIENDLATMGVTLGVATRGGPYYSWREIKVSGRENFFKALKDNNLFDDYKEEVQKALLSQGEVARTQVED